MSRCLPSRGVVCRVGVMVGVRTVFRGPLIDRSDGHHNNPFSSLKLTPKGRSIVRRPCSVPVSVHRTTATITHTDHDKDTPHTPQTHARNQQQSARFLQARLARRHRKAVLSQRMHAALPTERASAAQPELILHQQHERTSAQPKASGGSRARREKKPITRRRTSSSSSSSCPLGCHWTAPAARPPPPGPPRHLPRW